MAFRIYDRHSGTFRSARGDKEGRLEIVVRGTDIIHAHPATPSASELEGVAAYGPACAIWVGTSGDVTLTMASGASLLMPNVIARGDWTKLPLFTHITASTAGNIVVGY